MSPLPWFFVLLAALALIAGLVLLWESLRAALGASEPPELRASAEAEARRRLLERKESLLRNLRDLKFDRDGGKISTPDFDALDAKLRGQAKEVLRLLDEDVAPFKQKAEELVTERLGSERRDPYRDQPGDAPESDEAAIGGKAPTQLTCDVCETQNDPDAVFCKKCGARLPGKTAADVEGEAASDETREGEDA
jgi:hypothetical protein